MTLDQLIAEEKLEFPSGEAGVMFLAVLARLLGYHNENDCGWSSNRGSYGDLILLLAGDQELIQKIVQHLKDNQSDYGFGE